MIITFLIGLSLYMIQWILNININNLSLNEDAYIFIEIVIGILLASMVMYFVIKIITNRLKYKD
jgi:hypothetical protein